MMCVSTGNPGNVLVVDPAKPPTSRSYGCQGDLVETNGTEHIKNSRDSMKQRLIPKGKACLSGTKPDEVETTYKS
jgi:hypothetical protein